MDESLCSAIEKKSQKRIALSGGRTPLSLYQMLSKKNIPWSRREIFLVDERYVPLDHEASNCRMVRDSLISQIVEKPKRFVFFDTSLPFSDALATFDRELRNLSEPFFDLVLLGLGTDGHTASLFPGNVIPDDVLVAYTKASHAEVPDRLTMTERALLSSREIFFLIEGEGKMNVLDAALHGPPNLFPASRLLLRENTTIFTVP